MRMSLEAKEVVKNGKSTSPLSKSEYFTPETSDDDLNLKKNLKPNKPKSEFEEKIRVGKDYQAIIPEHNPKICDSEKYQKYQNFALLVWAPAKEIPENKLEDYIELAKERYGYNVEQALGMLFWHKHDLQRAILDLQNFTPFPDEWTKEDKILFEQAYQFHGKCFHRIRQMLPDKSIASLVKFYYSWKKARTRSSTERHERKKHEGHSENGSENGSPNDSDVEEKNDSDNDVKEMGEIEEIIGINNKDNSEQHKSPNNKTSIMTTSGNKAHKRKHEDDSHEYAEKKLAAEKMMSDKPEITITLKAKETTDVA